MSQLELHADSNGLASRRASADPVWDPDGGLLAATIRQNAVFLEENHDLRIGCQDTSCQLFETDLARVQVTGLADHELSGEATLQSTRYLGCGVMEYLATATTFETAPDGEPVLDSEGHRIVASRSLWR